MQNIDIMNNVNRAGYGPTITTGGGSMAQVAKQDQFVEDVHGIRRLVKAGDQVPNGLFAPGTVEVEERSVRDLARPVVDEDASKPSGTAADPNGGISFDRAEELRSKARGGGGSRQRKAQSGD